MAEEHEALFLRVLVHGRNFLIDWEGQQQKMNFYTTRFVRAVDHDEAEQLAVESLRTLGSLRDHIHNPPDDRPELIIEETEILPSFEGILHLEPGLAWYDPADQEQGEGSE